MGQRRSSFTRRQLKAEARRFLQLNRGLLAKIGLLAAVVCAIPLLLGTPAYATGLLHGAFIMTMFGIIAFGFLLSGSTVHLLAGSYGEAFTQEALGAARKDGSIWSAVHNVELLGQDIDHVVLTPSGVIAVESKWRFGAADAAWLAAMTDQAFRKAAKTRSVLRSKGIDEVHDVRPVLVVWGGAGRQLPPVQTIGNVAVVRGDSLQTWLTGCSRGPLAEDNAAVLDARLRHFADSQRIPA